MKLPKGFSLSGIHCGIKKRNLDLGLISCDDFFPAACFFTKNVNSSYSVVLSRENKNYPIKAVLVNSGNANCFSHRSGLEDTQDIVTELAGKLGVKDKNILIASTGIIGKKLPKEKIIGSLDALIKGLSGADGIKKFSQSICTTDTFKKISYAEVSSGKEKVNILGFAKGAGMIQPNMATMLAFILTDADLSQGDFKKQAKQAIGDSFNSISIDGCMSTNDTVFLLSSRKIPLRGRKEIDSFSRALKGVCLDLAKMIVKDAEGATKFIELEVRGAKTEREAKRCGFAIANSNLFKCAVYGEDANWGRIISALGQIGVVPGAGFSIKNSPLKQKEIKITVDLKRGGFAGKVYTSDLTPQYVKINAGYS